MSIDDRRRERFGRYEILAELGRGAMGVVYKARDPKINRVVAVKTISLAGQSPEEEKEYRERFLREAEAAGRLSHPGIVTIFDVGEEPESHDPFIVMEFVGGQSLDRLLSRDDHKLPVSAALQLTLELAEALDCAHGQGVVHRDLKPANILMTEDGHAKIADFGVAKLNLANHTLAGRALGTPAYMSPEQLNGDAVDGRSDLFSLGVVLYTVLTGYKPFQGNSAVTVSFKVVNRDPIRATLLDTELPQGLDYIISRAMAKDPAERYQRGMEMVLDIQELREGREPWSKAKLPGPPAGKNAGQAVNDGLKFPLGQPWIATQLLYSARALALRKDLLERIRGKSFTWRFVVTGLLVCGFGFALWAVAFGPRGVTPGVTEITRARTVEGPVKKEAPVKTAVERVLEAEAASEVAAPAANMAAADGRSTTAPVKDVLPLVPARRTNLRAAKVTRATAPTSSSAVSAAIPLPPVTVAAASVTTLEIEIEHKFAEAHLSIWLDDRPAYSHLLEGTDKKHLVVFHRVQGHEFHAMQVPLGKHRLRVQVTAAGASDQSSTVAGEFAKGQESVLHINFDKNGAMKLDLQ
jgi:tRNA A-37 threonylcarbamoyl transferase component Bud32